MDEIAVVQGLQAQVGEQVVPFRLQRLAQALQVVLHQFVAQQVQGRARFDVLAEIKRVVFRHLRLGCLRGSLVDLAQGFPAQAVQQQAGGDIGVIRFFFDQRPGAHDQRVVHVGLVDAVEQVA